MADIPLYRRLLPHDPRNRLSEAARRRISDAHADAELIRTRALAAIEARYYSELDRAESFSTYLATGRAAIEWAKAKVQAALRVLTVVRDEFRAAGCSRRELLQIMEDELDDAASSLELPTFQRNLVWQELRLDRDPEIADISSPVGNPSKADTPTARPKPMPAEGKDALTRQPFSNRASWLKERLQERSWNKHDLSRHGYGGPDHKTVQKILDGLPVREDVLHKVADALAKRKRTVTVLDIPQD